MAYDSQKDKEIKGWRIPVAEGQVAVVSLKSYNGGDPRLQIGPLEINQDGKIIHGRIKRWSWSGLLKLREALDEVIELMDELAAKGKSAARKGTNSKSEALIQTPERMREPIKESL